MPGHNATRHEPARPHRPEPGNQAALAFGATGGKEDGQTTFFSSAIGKPGPGERLPRSRGFGSTAGQNQFRREGPRLFERLWRAQNGLCYLCGELMRRDLAPQAASAPAIDHDHRCCGPHRHCARCVRGLAHNSCNKLIGFAGEDPGLLERIAASLRTATAATAQRMADGQLPLSA